MFTTYPVLMGADVLGYEGHPANAYAVERATDITHWISRSDGLFAPSHLRAAGGVRHMVMSLFWHSATVVLSRALMPASNLRGHLSWVPESQGQLALGTIRLWVNSLCLLHSS